MWISSTLKCRKNEGCCSREKQKLQMANTSTTLILVIVFCVSAAGGARTKLYSINGQDGNDGICKSVVETQGYICEEHTVTTQDGYILSMQRIPIGRSGKTTDRPPVLLQHGLIQDAITWMLNYPDKSLAFILADNGYDVWLANTRGSKYSRGHTSLSPDDPDYWDWSWDELAAYDLPASFQYVHDQTGQKLHYVGHSLGTLIALAAFSQKKLLTMLRSAALLTPIAYLGQISSLVGRSIGDLYLAEKLDLLGIYVFDLRSEVVFKLLEVICEKPGIDCTNLLTAFTGPNCCLNSSTENANYLEYEPQPTAMKNIIHLAQMIRQGTIAMHDYGNEEENMEKYGQSSPPVYNMSNIPNDVPLFLTYGGQDTLSDVKDVQILLESLKDHDAEKLVVQYVEEYAHADFIAAGNAKQVVSNPLMAFFKLH